MIVMPPESAAAHRPHRYIDIYRQALAGLESCLPHGWTITSDTPRSPAAPNRILVTAPDDEAVSYAVVASRGVLSGDVARIAADLGSGDRGFVCAHYLSDPVRRQLDDHRISYADATGNLSLVADRPAIWVRSRGADADPWRGPGRPSGVLTGEPSDRVVRALAEHAGELTVPELIRVSGTSTGAAYRVVEVLEERELIRRVPRGPITAVRWQPMLRAWADERKRCVSRHFAARDGLDATLLELAGRSGLGYAVSGLGAAEDLHGGRPQAGRLRVYADDVETFAAALNLHPVDRDGDVVVATPWSAVVFDRMRSSTGGLHLVAMGQLYADLLSGPFRDEEAAERLGDRLAAEASTWRRPVPR